MNKKRDTTTMMTNLLEGNTTAALACDSQGLMNTKPYLQQIRMNLIEDDNYTCRDSYISNR